MTQKIILTILGLIPIGLSIGAIAFIVNLSIAVSAGSLESNPSLKAFTYIGILFLVVIVAGFLYSAYKIFSYMRNNSI